MFRFSFPILVSLLIFASFQVKGQDTLLYLNGKKKAHVEVMKVDSEFIYYLKERK